MVEAWLEQASDAQILRAAVGQSPSLADVIRMVHPKPVTAERQALYAYLMSPAARAVFARHLPPHPHLARLHAQRAILGGIGRQFVDGKPE